ncbi:MAG: type I glyceraldehyde-3-phosphate dehydrogenase [Defluviitaleaceae bacterium]|nr:type I glyceraldehyde-3-phosphate dehydrogenase [Defluviitaleaceae bacterium]
MAIKVGINGFGRIGRLACRQMVDSPDFEVVAINDLTSPKMLAYLFKYDSAQGSLGKNCDYTPGGIIADGLEIPIYAEKDPKNLPWGQLGIDVVLECTGFFASKKASMSHIEAGAKKVIISAPGGNDLPTIVYGVNENSLQPEDTVISAASCTTNCLAPMAAALDKLAPIQKGFMTTIHAYTNDQNTLDSPHPKGDLRRTRAAASNIIPQPTGAASAIGLVIPGLAGKLDGAAQRIPVITGSITELVAVVRGGVSAEQVNEAMKAAAAASHGSFGYTEDEIVSADIIGITCGSLFDATQTKVTDLGQDSLVKVAAWYDNENSYASQMVRVISYLGGM